MQAVRGGHRSQIKPVVLLSGVFLDPAEKIADWLRYVLDTGRAVK